ncbi:betaine aldehyde dehydrogenase 1 [Trichodelitschia bisporula]|uniref:aldehyde dehydrogenase (NAD(+)) n=1 Tax=Trichodelitschia bisporula TaxID=703511 RepID=A0A6G1I0W6_9PEZI|nr:betaine aldehyde dehydrogenase 1 [Trichodelitschia bisporula]
MVATKPDIDFETFYNIVDGQKRSASSFTNGVDPTTAEKLWDVPVATEQDVNDAVDAGNRAFKSWSKTPIEKRRELMNQFVDLYDAYTKEFTTLICKETGKPAMFGGSEVQSVKEMISHHASLDLPVEKYEDDDKSVTTRFVPLGVVGAICPWNFPMLLSAGKIGPALIAGCTIILKPSPFTPYTGLKLVELAQSVFPPGVVQALGGDDRLGPWMTAHPGIAKISFTGSVATGKRIMEACSKTLKRITLELGGNDPCIVMPDVDLDKAVPEVTIGCFFNSGQVCVATKRVYIHESIYDEFVKRMVAFTKAALKVGPSHEPGVMIGPIQNSMQYERVKGFFDDSKKQGYKFATGEPEVREGKGFWITPTIIDNPPTESRIIQEEPFGPIVPTQPWSDLDEVIARANNTNVGLGASVFTKDIAKGEEIAAQLEAGNVFINSFTKPIPQAYFSGHKESGIGGEWGNQGVLSYCNAHAVHVYKKHYASSAPKSNL